MKLLSCKDNAEVIDWMPSGNSFLIKKPKAFTTEILPAYFKNAKYSSFTRKLHRWGFMRHYRGLEAGAFFHSDFQRDRIDLVEKMTCYKLESMPSTGTVQVNSSPATELFGDHASFVTPVDPKHSVLTLLDHSVSSQQPDAFPVVDAAILNKAETVSPEFCQRANPYPDTMSALKQNMESSLRVESSLGFPSPLNVDAFSGKLNAAIEAEVSRRLNERINAAALTSQAIALMQSKQIWPSNPAIASHLLGWKQEQMRRPEALLNGQNASTDPRAALSLSGSHGLFKHPALNLSSLGGFQSLRTLPRTNIEGAKTA